MQLVEENYEYKYRIELSCYEYNSLVELIKEAQKSDIYINQYMLEQFENYKLIKISQAKRNAITKANKARSKKTKEKFDSAVSALMREESELTPYKIAKKAGISFTTAKKYLKQLNENNYLSINDE